MEEETPFFLFPFSARICVTSCLEIRETDRGDGSIPFSALPSSPFLLLPLCFDVIAAEMIFREKIVFPSSLINSFADDDTGSCGICLLLLFF